MNIRTFIPTLILITPLLVFAAASETQTTAQQPIKQYWNKPLNGVSKAPIAPSCDEYIERGRWEYRSSENLPEWSLSLTPTVCGRYIDISETGLMFYEIVKKFGQSPYWTNNRGMINQLTCHLANAKEKPQWNLEPFRPYVGFRATADAMCNPTVPNPDPAFQ